MTTAHKISRWAALKTAAQLADCSVNEARALVRSKRWKARRLGKGKRAHLRVAIGQDNWPVPGGKARA